MERLNFKKNKTSLTIGVEMELQVLDHESLLLTPRANELIEKISSKKLKPEFFQSSLEVVTGVCKDVHDIQADLSKSLQLIKENLRDLGLKISSTGTHPEADYRDRLVTPSPRYNELLDRNQWIIRRMAVYGMHIHLGMESGDACIRFHNFFLNFVPHFLALSASSPFWQKMHTGLSCSRLTMYEAMPTSGMPHIVNSWNEFEEMFSAMRETEAIKSVHDLWLDMRPSPEIGTLEIRVCDQPATISEALAIVAYVHSLAHWYKINYAEWDSINKVMTPWVLRENKWRAIRYGLSAGIIKSPSNEIIKMKDDVSWWIKMLQQIAKKFGYEKFFLDLQNIVDFGNSAERQLRIFTKTNDLHDVVRYNVSEFEK
ncbi:MAG TPA: YbdK family carboxylate-amine ligase [Cyclobacteriaceae bacterium]|nr:YbdK family carboxylate-amine ligase [Cyclobacteriaceae bacterium]